MYWSIWTVSVTDLYPDLPRTENVKGWQYDLIQNDYI